MMNSVPIDGETVTFREGRWCCTCRDYEDKGTCAHELEAIARLIEEKERPEGR